jgi:uncharacterized membrane protein YhaH (DUF805 family)
MYLNKILKKATNFKDRHSQKNFFAFVIKCFFFIIPALVLGNYTDRMVEKVKKNKILGNNTLYYILLQTMIVIISLYLILLISTDYINSFGFTLSGNLFITLYFGTQINYILMIKECLNNNY